MIKTQIHFVPMLCCILSLLMTGCAMTSKETPTILENQRPIEGVQLEPEIRKFSQMISKSLEISEQSEISSNEDVEGWYLWSLAPHKKKTKYYLHHYQGKSVIHADARSSASGLIVPLKAKDIQGFDLQWTWKALKNIALADNTQGHTDDAPLRIVLGFEGDKSSLPLKDQLAFDLAKLISGHDLPYATLMYIWSEKNGIEEVITNKHISRIKAIVVDSGAKDLGEWRTHRRSIEADFKKAYGENPGKLIAIGIMTDTDNTNEEVQAKYGDIEFQRRSNR
ncbi:DUF3047 domain-containing protein [Polynucleobacter rarus]|uniref:DUF3047 domain-containing protein n=1 Tax=Polynucleobacter rarus TaxID=556055 RepID=UPI000D3E99FA|nr:DUF3047 domain-containing protein [Polynucleobacter rarus]